VAKEGNKYWCKLCSRSHKDRETYLKHKERLEKRKTRRKKKVEKGDVEQKHLETKQVSPGLFVSDDPLEIAAYLRSQTPVRIVTTNSTVSKVEGIMPKVAHWDVKKLSTVKKKPGQDTQNVKQLMQVYTCENCEYFLDIGKGHYGCEALWSSSSGHYDFSVILDKVVCMKFSREY